jgi:hypothetical protein
MISEGPFGMKIDSVKFREEFCYYNNETLKNVIFFRLIITDFYFILVEVKAISNPIY